MLLAKDSVVKEELRSFSEEFKVFVIAAFDSASDLASESEDWRLMNSWPSTWGIVDWFTR